MQRNDFDAIGRLIARIRQIAGFAVSADFGLRLLTIGLLLLPSVVSADDDYLFTYNTAGGLLVLTTDDCVVDMRRHPERRRAFTEDRDGNRGNGCWEERGSGVLVTFDSGVEVFYGADFFRPAKLHQEAARKEAT